MWTSSVWLTTIASRRVSVCPQLRGKRNQDREQEQGQETLSHSYRSACPRTVENFDFQWDVEVGNIGKVWGMEPVIKEQLWACQGKQVQGVFMTGVSLANNNRRKRRIKQSVTYVKTGVWYLKRDVLGTQFGLLGWGSHFFKYCLQLGIRCKQGIEKTCGAFKSQVACLVIQLLLWFKFITNYTLRRGIWFS